MLVNDYDPSLAIVMPILFFFNLKYTYTVSTPQVTVAAPLAYGVDMVLDNKIHLLISLSFFQSLGNLPVHPL